MSTIGRRAKHPPWVYAQRILKNVWTDPAIGGPLARPRALGRVVGWQVFKRVARKPVVWELLPNVKIWCHPDSSVGSKIIYLDGFTDHHEGEFLKAILRAGDSVLDGGANIGSYALLFASIVGESGEVHSFEPFTPVRRRLKENVELNRFESIVTVHGEGLSNQAGTIRFVADKDVANRVMNESDEDRDSVTIPLATLDGKFDDTSFFVAKIDVEGSEMDALTGGESLFENRPPPVVLIEVIDRLLRKQGSSAEEVLAWLRARGYELFEFDGAGQLIRVRAIQKGNVVALLMSSDDLQKRLAASSYSLK